MRSKIFKVCLIVLLVGVAATAIVSKIKLENEKKSVTELNKNINEVVNKKSKAESDNNNYKTEIESLKEEKKDRLEEEEIWIKAIEKLDQALS